MSDAERPDSPASREISSVHFNRFGKERLPRFVDGEPQFDWRFLSWLGFPNFGLAFTISVISTALPVILRDRTSSNSLLGLIVGGEGAFALMIPIITGSLSDRLRSRLGGRFPFMLVAAPVAGAAIAVMPLHVPLWCTAIFVAIFYVGYFSFYPPYTALYPDLVPRRLAGRAQGGQAFWRGIGFGAGLVGGIGLFAVWKPLPFILGGAILVVGTIAFCLRIDPTPLQRYPQMAHESVMHSLAASWRLVRYREGVAWFLMANSCWEFSLAALRSFALLFLTRGLGKSYVESMWLIGIVAACTVAASLVAGRAGDRFGLRRTMLVACAFYGVGLCMPFAATVAPVWLLALSVPFIGFGGAVVMTLPYGLLTKLLPEEGHGAASGLFNVSRGIGVSTGPYVAGLLIDKLHNHVPAHGYSAMWIAISGSMLLSIPFVWRLRSTLPSNRARPMPPPYTPTPG